MRALAVAIAVALISPANPTSAAPATGHPWAEQLRTALGGELEANEVAQLAAIDLSRTAGKRDADLAYALADLVARDLAPRALQLATLPELARRLASHAPVTDASSARAIAQQLRAVARMARAMSPARCGRAQRCPASLGQQAAELVDMAAEAMDDLRDDPRQSVQLAVDMFEAVASSTHTMTEEAGIKAARTSVLAATHRVYRELVGLVDAQRGPAGSNPYVRDYRAQLLDLVGDGLHLDARARTTGTDHVPLVLRLADHVVRDLTARAFDDAGRPAEASQLRTLAPLRDAAAVQLAQQLLQRLPATDSVHHALAATADALEALATPDDLDAGSGITANAAQATATLLGAITDRVSLDAERTAKRQRAGLATAILQRLR